MPERATDPYFEKIYYAELPERGDVNSALRLAKKYNREGKVWYQSRHGYKYGAFTDGKHYRDKVLKEQQEHVAMARVPDEADYDAEGAEIIIADGVPQGRVVTTDLVVNLAAGIDASRTQDENNATHASWRREEEVPNDTPKPHAPAVSPPAPGPVAGPCGESEPSAARHSPWRMPVKTSDSMTTTLISDAHTSAVVAGVARASVVMPGEDRIAIFGHAPSSTWGEKRPQ